MSDQHLIVFLALCVPLATFIFVSLQFWFNRNNFTRELTDLYERLDKIKNVSERLEQMAKRKDRK